MIKELTERASTENSVPADKVSASGHLQLLRNP